MDLVTLSIAKKYTDKKIIESGETGITPSIGANGNWYFGSVDTGKPSRGEQGPKGDNGPAGADGRDGQDGQDGYTPVKGTDYYTEADKAEMVQAVLDALPDGDEVAY